MEAQEEVKACPWLLPSCPRLLPAPCTSVMFQAWCSWLSLSLCTYVPGWVPRDIESPENKELLTAWHQLFCAKTVSPTLSSQEAPHLLRYGLRDGYRCWGWGKAQVVGSKRKHHLPTIHCGSLWAPIEVFPISYRSSRSPFPTFCLPWVFSVSLKCPCCCYPVCRRGHKGSEMKPLA